jgi:hypothetical protein
MNDLGKRVHPAADLRETKVGNVEWMYYDGRTRTRVLKESCNTLENRHSRVDI